MGPGGVGGIVGIGGQRLHFPQVFTLHLFPAVKAAILADGADLGADPAGVTPPPYQILVHLQAGSLVVVSDHLILPHDQGPFRAAFGAGPALDAEFFRQQRISGQLGGGQDRDETHAGAEGSGQQAMADADRPQSCVFRRHDMAESGKGGVPQRLEVGVGVAAEKGGGATLPVEEAGQLVGQRVELVIHDGVHLLVEHRGRCFHDRQQHRQPHHDHRPGKGPERPRTELGGRLAEFIPALHGGESHEFHVPLPAEAEHFLFELLFNRFHRPFLLFLCPVKLKI
ncbi:MAG: hypothetical protein A4E72_01547 [Syntrophus sp. PtaU1.Bin208]|nr:MAG: hypothetical protein A4E72_01547 [Syntrophus sp. PtaU1.Bin208]